MKCINIIVGAIPPSNNEFMGNSHSFHFCNRWEIICCEFDYDLIPSWEETVFPTREEAEAALKKRVKGEQNEKM